MENSEHRSEEYIISQEELKEAFIKWYRDAELRGLNTVWWIKLLIEEILKKSNKT
jgi:hypothetical protein